MTGTAAFHRSRTQRGSARNARSVAVDASSSAAVLRVDAATRVDAAVVIADGAAEPNAAAGYAAVAITRPSEPARIVCLPTPPVAVGPGFALDQLPPTSCPDPRDLAAWAAWLAARPSTSALWTVLPYIADSIALEEWGGERIQLDEVPPKIKQAGRSLMEYAMRVGFYDKAPPLFIDGVRNMLAAWSKKGDGSDGWFRVLRNTFSAYADGIPGKSERARVKRILESLERNCVLAGVELPDAFRAPRKESLERAADAIRRTVGPARRRGRPYSAESKAREFARAFGIHAPRSIDVRRPR